MKKSDYITIAKKLMKIADSGKTVEEHFFDMRERELLRELIVKCNEVIVYEICETDGSNGKVEPKKKGKFSFQRG